MKATMFIIDGIGHLSIEMKNTPIIYKLLGEMKSFTLQRYYWRSKLDYNHIEYFEPKIFDAFIFCVDFIGDPQDMKFHLEQFELNRKFLEKLEEHYHVLTEKEIKSIADEVLLKI